MAKWFRFRVLSLLILVSVIGIGLAIYLDWESQRYQLRPGLKHELSRRFQKEGGLIGGVPFQFCIDDDIIFTGRSTSSFSSFGSPISR
jgi:hypothetical protein